MKIERDCFRNGNAETFQPLVEAFASKKGSLKVGYRRYRKNYSKQLEIILSGNHFGKIVSGIQSEQVGKYPGKCITAHRYICCT
jgi:hypothetical protein